MLRESLERRFLESAFDEPASKHQCSGVRMFLSVMDVSYWWKWWTPCRENLRFAYSKADNVYPPDSMLAGQHI